MFCHSPIVGLRISPAAVVGDDFADGSDDRVAELGVRGEAIEDGLVDGGPEFVFRRRIVGVGGDQEDLVLGRVVGRLFRDFRGGQKVPVEIRLVIGILVGVEELVVVDVVVMFHAQALPLEPSRRDEESWVSGEAKLFIKRKLALLKRW